MRKLLFLLLIVLPQIIAAQTSNAIPKAILGEYKLIPAESDKFILSDFSRLWIDTSNIHIILGIIGKEHQRIKVKFLTVRKNENNPLIYNVTGKTSVMGNVCDFTGTIQISKLYFLESDSNITNEYSSKYKGLVVADYHLKEDSTQFHVGIFKGVTCSRWESADMKIIELANDTTNSYFMNNSFVGTWSSYSGKDTRLCNWGIFRVPEANQDFDDGTGKFSPAEKYHKFGWKSYYKAYILNDIKMRMEEESNWWQ